MSRDPYLPSEKKTNVEGNFGPGFSPCGLLGGVTGELSNTVSPLEFPPFGGGGAPNSLEPPLNPQEAFPKKKRNSPPLRSQKHLGQNRGGFTQKGEYSNISAPVGNSPQKKKNNPSGGAPRGNTPMSRCPRIFKKYPHRNP